MENQRKIILTIYCQVTGKKAFISDTLLEDEWGKEEETTSPHCKLKQHKCSIFFCYWEMKNKNFCIFWTFLRIRTTAVSLSSFTCILSSYLLHYCFVSSKEKENLVSSPWPDKSQIQNTYMTSERYSDLPNSPHTRKQNVKFHFWKHFPNVWRLTFNAFTTCS